MSLSSYLSSKYPLIIEYLSYSDLSFIVSEAVRAYGVDTEAEATDLDKLYYFGKVEFLKQALDDLSVNIQFVGNQKASFARKEIYNQVNQLLSNTLQEGSKYSNDYKIKVGKIKYVNDPYSLETYENFWN